jgi:nucleoside-diphosphate-sugar epimerase
MIRDYFGRYAFYIGLELFDNEVMAMRIFMTGGSGFVGAHTIEQLSRDGHDVVALVRSDASAERVRQFGAEPLRGDLEDFGAGTPSWTAELKRCDAVVHAAAYLAFWGPDRLFEQRNLQPSVALHAAAVDAGVRRFILLSASSISSGSQRAPVVSEQTDDGQPNVAYSRVKQATENALRNAPSKKTELIILRPPFIWGAGMNALDEMVQSVKAGQWAWIDHGGATLDFVHVENLAQVISLALDHGTPGHTYYITDDHPRTVHDFIGALIETQGVTPGERSVPRPVALLLATLMEGAFKLARRPTAPPLTRWIVCVMARDRSYDITAAKRDLGYAPSVSFEAGLAAMRADVRRELEPTAAGTSR